MKQLKRQSYVFTKHSFGFRTVLESLFVRQKLKDGNMPNFIFVNMEVKNILALEPNE